MLSFFICAVEVRALALWELGKSVVGGLKVTYSRSNQCKLLCLEKHSTHRLGVSRCHLISKFNQPGLLGVGLAVASVWANHRGKSARQELEGQVGGP